MPHLEEQCPAHKTVRPTPELQKEAVAWMTLDAGKLHAVQAKSDGPVSAEYSRKAPRVVTIIGTTAAETWTIVVEGDAQVTIVNAPAERGDIMPNHFLAYYRLLMPSSCCTNVPFPFKRRGCAINPAKVDVPGTDHDLASTVACSNSNYP